MSINTSISPYNDDFEPSKKYAQILAVPGRAEQAREFTQAQSILLHIIKKLSAAVLNEGSIISGMDFTIQDNTVTVNPGQIYLNGIVHDFDGQEVYISKSGEERIGAKLISSIITEAQDTTLRDPAQGYANYSQPGAHRLKYEVQLVLNDSTVPTIYTLVDGLLQLEIQKPQLDVVTDLLAKRMFDESGNYLVSGMSMYTKESEDVNSITLVVNAGRAYVQGYEVNRPSPAYITISKSQDTRSVIGELKVYHTGTDLYKLNNLNANQITQVIATVSVTQTVTRGNIANGMDLLPKTPVLSITSIVQGETTYVAGTSYQLSGDSVDWSLGGAEPSNGSTYSITYQYNKELVLGVDYQLTNQGTLSYLDLSPSGDNPVDSSNVTVSYDYYLARADRIYLDKDGAIDIMYGQSDISSLIGAPEDKDSYRLSLGTISLQPNSSTVTVKNETITRLSMKDLANLTARVDNIEYNTAINELDNEAMSGQSPTAMKGVLTDGFLGFSKTDLGHDLYNASIDVENNELELPSDYSIFKANMNTGASSGVITGNYILGSYSEETVINQSLSTGTINVNPYKVFTNSPTIILSPSVDNWINTSNITVDGGVQTQTQYVVWSRRYKPADGTIVSTSKSTNTKVRDSILPYARQIPITITGNGFPDYSDSFKATIDGVSVNLSPVGGSGTTVGTAPGSVKASSNGSISATFTIPSGIRSGATQVVLSNGLYSANAVFTATGISRITQVTNTTVVTLTKRYDPVAQTFQLPVDRMITSCNLWFASKDPSIPITIQIRNVINGYPGVDVLASRVLSSSQVNTSSNGQANPTPVTFNNPVLCNANEQYCIVILSTSDQYQLHVATLSHNDLTTGKLVTTQPYTEGSLFTSSNGITWTPDQTSDLRFELKAAVFGATNKTIQFDSISSINIDGIIAMMDFDLPTGTSAHWQYKIGTGSWLPITANDLFDISVATSITLRAIFTCTRNLSPILLVDSANIVGTQVSTSGIYVGKLVTTSQSYANVKVIMECALPSGSTVVPQISTDDNTWVTPTQVSAEPNSDGVYTRFTYTYTIPDSGSSTKYRCRINLSTSSRLSKPKVRKLLNILT